MMRHAAAPDSSPDPKLPREARSACPIANGLDLLGDRWTLLVVRDLRRGKHRFVDFATSAEHIPTNLLADRLKRLERAGIIRSKRYSRHPPRSQYVLTPKGEDLAPVLDALVGWGLRHVPGTKVRDLP